MSLKEKEILSWISLSRIEGIGPVSFFGLLSKFGTAENALKEIPKLKSKKTYNLIDSKIIEDEYKKTMDFGGEYILAKDDLYPLALSKINPPPPIISVIGNKSLLQKQSIGIVGARNASGVGIRFTREIAKFLGQKGYSIASGLARGIDSAAHVASLETGTIAVVAGGINHIYPPENTELYHKIKETGLIVSENGFNAPVFARDFPRRNRIISGLSIGVIIVEAEEKSGSLITARFANEQGREVMAVPGSPLDPRAWGPNSLIKEGASLIMNGDDVIDCLAGFTGLRENNKDYTYQEAALNIDNSIKAQILELLSPTPISMDELCQISLLPWRTIAAIIVELELEGKAYIKNGNSVANQP